MQLSHRGLTDGDRTSPGTVRSRTGAIVAVFLAVLAMVVGCSSTPPPAPVDESVTVTHKFGETKIPANPTNVVTVGWNDQDFVLALDVVPVATREWFDNYNDFPWVKEATGGKGVTTLGGDGIDYESIAAAKPDLIFAIYETIDKPTYDRLSQIAPTV
ncbi:ABC transporter substrate-binding protein, partial [Pseudonocardia sp.]|uniref:ABC transporter substrate-binding protein n=1 Tax=Pseudonocardia sp. TaxID=60912 RepID=UPI003D112601